MQAHLFLPKLAPSKPKRSSLAVYMFFFFFFQSFRRVWQQENFLRRLIQDRSEEKKWLVIILKDQWKEKKIKEDGKGRGKEEKKGGKEEREKKGKPIKREEAWEKGIQALMCNSCWSKWMHLLNGVFFLSAPCLFTASLRSQPTGSSVRHCRGGRPFELQAFCTPKLHTVMHIVFELFRNTEANYSWHVLLPHSPSRLPSHVELCHIKCTKP